MGRSSMSFLKVTLPLAICLLFCLISRMDAKTLLVETEDKNKDSGLDYNKGDGKGKGNDNGQLTPDNDYGEPLSKLRGKINKEQFKPNNDYGEDYRFGGLFRLIGRGVKAIGKAFGKGAAEAAGAEAVSAVVDHATKEKPAPVHPLKDNGFLRGP